MTNAEHAYHSIRCISMACDEDNFKSAINFGERAIHFSSLLVKEESNDCAYGFLWRAYYEVAKTYFYMKDMKNVEKYINKAEKLLISKLTDYDSRDSNFRQSQLNVLKGEFYASTDKLDLAFELYTALYDSLSDTIKHLDDKEPVTSQWYSLYGKTCSFLGYHYLSKDEQEKAFKLLHEAFIYFEKDYEIIETHRSKTDLLQGFYCENSIYEEKIDFESANPWLKKAVDLAQNMYLEYGTPRMLVTLSTAYFNMATNEFNQRNMEKARYWINKAIVLHETRCKSSNTLEDKKDLLVCYSISKDIYFFQDDEANTQFEVLRIHDLLKSIDIDNMDIERYKSFYECVRDLIEKEYSNENYQQAKEYLVEYNSYIEKVLKTNNSQDTLSDYALSLLQLGEIELQLKEYDESYTHLYKANNIFDALLDEKLKVISIFCKKFLSLCLFSLNKDDEGKSLCHQILELCENIDFYGRYEIVDYCHEMIE